mgnify:FL=1|jgi:hypothetical protein
MNDKIITALLACLLALGGWTLSRTFSLSQDMVLVKEKISGIEKDMEEAVWNTLEDVKAEKRKQKRKRKNNKKNKKKQD